MSQRVGRQPLHAPRAPKTKNIDDMLKFVREQQEKPSEAAETAKKLKQLSSQSKQREKFASSSKAFMELFRSLVKQESTAQSMSTTSLISLSSIVPELPSLLQLDANLQASLEKEHASCLSYKERLESILIRQRNRQSAEMFNNLKAESEEFLKTLELPDQYDQLVSVIESTKIPPPAPASYSFPDLNDEWRGKAEELVSVFAEVDRKMHEDYRKWQVTNGYDPAVPFGGWDEFDHQRFVLTHGNSEVEFGKVPGAEIARHQAWTIRTRFLTKKSEALRAELMKRIASLREEAIEAERARKEREANEAAISARRAEFAEQKGDLDARLEVERAQRAQREAGRLAREAEIQAEQEAEAALQKEAKEKEAQALKSKVTAEKQRRMAREAQIQEKKAAALKREQEAEKVKQKQRIQTVEKRQDIEKEKQKLRDQRAAEIQQIADEKERRLALLAQSVIDEFGLDEVEADPARLTKLQEMRRKMPKEQKPMFVANSFPSSLIEADPRIRVENALREAGLMNSPYAQQVIHQMSALRPTPAAGAAHINLT